MTPAAHIASTIEVLDSMLTAWAEGKRAPADASLERFFKARRYMGSKDRGKVAELIYWILRHKASLAWWCARLRQPETARALVITALSFRKDITPEQCSRLFSGEKYAPAMLTDGEWQLIHRTAQESFLNPDMPHHVQLNFPAWMEAPLADSLGKNLNAEMRAMQEQAPVDLRVNSLKLSREALMQRLNAEGFTCAPTPLSPLGIRLHKREALFASPLFKDGFFEMQDEGSQIVSLLVDAEPGMRVIDFCAGAGGKTLAIAAQMKNKGRILAFDTSERRLDQIKPRLKRAGVDNVEVHHIASEHDSYIKRHKESADRVVVDAPCTGTGTWRRSPDLKWRTTQDDLAELSTLQLRILESAARLVKKNGRLIYITCSLLREENDKRIGAFLKTRNNFRVVCTKKIWNKFYINDTLHERDGTERAEASDMWLSPHQDGTDGFYACVLERIG